MNYHFNCHPHLTDSKCWTLIYKSFDEEYDCVPSCWLTEGKDKCKWPINRTISQLKKDAKSGEEIKGPSKLVAVEVVKEDYASYDACIKDAVRKTNKRTLAEESEAQRKQSRHKRKESLFYPEANLKTPEDSHKASTPSTSGTDPTSMCPCPGKYHVCYYKEVGDTNPMGKFFCLLSKQQEAQKTERKLANKAIMSKLEELESMVKAALAKQQQQQLVIQQNAANVSQPPAVEVPPDPEVLSKVIDLTNNFPITNLEVLEDVNNLLKENDLVVKLLAKKLIMDVKKAATMASTARCLLSSMLGKTVVSNFTWMGVADDKQSFVKHGLKLVLIECLVLLYPSETGHQAQISKSIGQWFSQFAPEGQEKKEKRRKRSKHTSKSRKHEQVGKKRRLSISSSSSSSCSSVKSEALAGLSEVESGTP